MSRHKRGPHKKTSVVKFFLGGDIFLTTFHGLYFSHQCTLQTKFLHVGPLCAASMKCCLHLSSNLWDALLLFEYQTSLEFGSPLYLPWHFHRQEFLVGVESFPVSAVNVLTHCSCWFSTEICFSRHSLSPSTTAWQFGSTNFWPGGCRCWCIGQEGKTRAPEAEVASCNRARMWPWNGFIRKVIFWTILSSISSFTFALCDGGTAFLIEWLSPGQSNNYTMGIWIPD